MNSIALREDRRDRKGRDNAAGWETLFASPHGPLRLEPTVGIAASRVHSGRAQPTRGALQDPALELGVGDGFPGEQRH